MDPVADYLLSHTDPDPTLTMKLPHAMFGELQQSGAFESVIERLLGV